MISFTCQYSRTGDLIESINAIIQVNSAASMINEYWERAFILSHSTALPYSAFFSMARLTGVIRNKQDRAVATCGTERPTRTLAGM